MSSIFPNMLDQIFQKRGLLGDLSLLKNPQYLGAAEEGLRGTVPGKKVRDTAQSKRELMSVVVRSGMVSSQEQAPKQTAEPSSGKVNVAPTSGNREFWESLPIFPFLGPIRDAILRNDITVIHAPTGSGKSTVLPILLAEMDIGQVIVTNPRRYPCELLGRFGGEHTGFRHGVGRDVGPDAKAIYTTAAYEQKRQLSGRAEGPMVVVLDEFHELTKETTLLLEVLMERQRNGEHIKIVIASATIDGDNLQQALVKKHPELAVESVGVPVAHRFPVVRLEPKPLSALPEAVAFQKGALVFQYGHQPIVDLAGKIKVINPKAKIVVFSAELSEAEKEDAWKAMERGNAIMLATEALKSSATVPNLKHVHATPYVRAQEFGPDGEKRLAIQQITIDTVDQQAGRTGRVCPGDFSPYGFHRENLEPCGLPQIATQPLLTEVFDFAVYFESEAAKRGVSPVRYATNFLRSAVYKATEQQIRFAEYQLQTLGVISPQGYVTQFGRTLEKWGGDIRTRIMLSRADHISQQLGQRPEKLIGQAIDAAAMLEVDGIFARRSPIHDLLGRGIVYDGWRNLEGMKIDSASDVVTQMRVFQILASQNTPPRECAQWGVDARKMHEAMVVREKLRGRCAEVLTKRARQTAGRIDESAVRGHRTSSDGAQASEAGVSHLRECIVAAYLDTLAFFERGSSGSPHSSGYRPLASAGPGYMRTLAKDSVANKPRFVVGNWITIDSSPDLDEPARLITLGTKVDPAWLSRWVKEASTAPRDVVGNCGDALSEARRLAQQQARKNRPEGPQEPTVRRRHGDPGRNRR